MAGRTINIDKIVIKRGNTSAISNYTGPMGELVMDTETNSVYIQDGVNPGGHDLSTGSAAYGNTQVVAYLVSNPINGTYSNVNVAAYLSGNIATGNITTHNITADNFFNANGVSLTSLIEGAGTGYFTFHNNTSPAEVISVSNANDVWLQGGGFHHASDTYPSLFLLLHGSDGEGTGGAEIDITPDGLTLWSKYGEGINPGVKWDFGQTGTLTAPGNIIPSANLAYSLGDVDNWWSSLYVGGNTIYINGVPLSIGAGNTLTFNDQPILSSNTLADVTSSGNISASNFSSDNFTFANGVPISQRINSLYNNGHTATLDTTGNLQLPGGMYVAGNLVIAGNTYVENNFQLSVSDNIINVHSNADLSPLTYNDGKDVGLKFHYYKVRDSHAFLGWANDTGYLEWYDDGNEVGNVFVGTSYGNIKAGGFIGNTAIINGINIVSNLGTITTSLQTLNANVGAYQTYANANASTQQTSINSINANLGAYQTYANTQLGLKATISGPTFTGTVTIPTLTVTGNTTSGNILNSVTNTYGNVQVGANLRNLTTNITTTANVSAGNISVTNKSSLTTLTVTGTAAFNGLTQIQQLDLPYTAKTAATGTITHDCSVGQTFYHTSISANFTPNFTNLGLVSGYVTEVKLYLVQGSSSRSVTAMQIDGVAKTINWYNAVAPTYSSNAVDIITFEILLVNTTYTVFGKVEKYDSVAAGGGGG